MSIHTHDNTVQFIAPCIRVVVEVLSIHTLAMYDFCAILRSIYGSFNVGNSQTKEICMCNASRLESEIKVSKG